MKKIKIIISSVFILLLLIPMPSAAILDINSENMPRFSDYFSVKMLFDNRKNSSGFFSDSEKFISDNLPIRNQLLRANSFVQSKVLKSTSANVITGKDGYLFSTEELNDAVAVDTMSKTEVNNLVRTLDLIDEYCRDRGAKFAFVIAPNKSTVLSEKLPYYINKSSAQSNLDILRKRLGDRDYFIDVTPSLDGKPELYHKTDTHWNNIGAKTAYTDVMSRLGKEGYKEYNDLVFTKKYCWQGDLTDMLYPESGKVSDYQYVSDLPKQLANSYEVGSRRESKEYSPAEYLEHITGDKDNKVINAKTKNRRESGRLIMLRDSFARAMMPYFIDNFKECEFVISNGIFNSYTHEIENGDYLILEISERSVKKITEDSQLIEAKRVDNAEIKSKIRSVNNIASTSKEFAYYEIFGSLDKALMKDSSDITLKLSGEGNEYFYKALPVYHESNVTVQGGETNFFLSSYFEDVPNGTYSVEAIVNGVSTGAITNISISEGE